MYRFLLWIIFFTGLTVFLYPGSKLETIPMKPRVIQSIDGEFLKYGTYVNGERKSMFQLVTRINEQKEEAFLYFHGNDFSSRLPLPAHYTNYGFQMVISTKYGSLSSVRWNFLEDTKKEGRKSNTNFILEVDSENQNALYRSIAWDGSETRSTSSKINLKKDIPIWTIESSSFGAARFLDIKSPGIIQVVIPNLKQTIPGRFIYLGNEILSTPAGKFNTLKVGFIITDPFLSRLLERYLKEMFFWIEDGPRALIVKTQRPDEINILEEIGKWKE